MKIVISDFDNTFFTDKYLENIDVINEFVNKGNKFVIATGRPLYLLKKDIENVNIPYCNLICSDGTIIFDREDKIVYRETIDSKIVKKIIDELKESDCVEDWYNNEAYQFSKDVEAPSNGILGVPKDRDKALELINNLNKKYPDTHSYLSHKWINILNKETSKGTGIEALIEIHGWNAEDVITMGDELNDVPMNAIFNSYTFDYACDELKDVSTYVVKDFEEAINHIYNN